jgi:actin-related protein 6
MAAKMSSSSSKVVLDNGAYIAKSALSNDQSVRLTPNYLAKSKNARESYIGSEVDDCKDYSGLFYNLAFHKVSIPLKQI